MITVPMIGWSPMLGSNRSIIYSYAVSKYGPQTAVDYWRPNAGNGISVTNNTPITWNNPNDANFPTTTVFQQSYVQHLIGKWGLSATGGVGYYLMDNEHSIWFSTHQDVHPVGPTMQEIWTKMLATASMVKSNDPNALVLGRRNMVGTDISTAVTISNGPASTAAPPRPNIPTGAPTEGGITCPGCSTSFTSMTPTPDSDCWITSLCTATRM